MMVGPSLFRVSLPMPIQPQASIKLVPHKPAHGGQRGGGIKLVPHKPAHGGQRGGGIKLVPHKPAHGGQRGGGIKLVPHKPAHGGQRGGGIKLVPHKPAHGGQRGLFLQLHHCGIPPQLVIVSSLMEGYQPIRQGRYLFLQACN